jgi:hypothetical protein
MVHVDGQFDEKTDQWFVFVLETLKIKGIRVCSYLSKLYDLETTGWWFRT